MGKGIWEGKKIEKGGSSGRRAGQEYQQAFSFLLGGEKKEWRGWAHHLIIIIKKFQICQINQQVKEKLFVFETPVERLDVGEDALPIGTSHEYHILHVQQRSDAGLFTLFKKKLNKLIE